MDSHHSQPELELTRFSLFSKTVVSEPVNPAPVISAEEVKIVAEEKNPADEIKLAITICRKRIEKLLEEKKGVTPFEKQAAIVNSWAKYRAREDYESMASVCSIGFFEPDFSQYLFNTEQAPILETLRREYNEHNKLIQELCKLTHSHSTLSHNQIKIQQLPSPIAGRH